VTLVVNEVSLTWKEDFKLPMRSKKDQPTILMVKSRALHFV